MLPETGVPESRKRKIGTDDGGERAIVSATSCLLHNLYGFITAPAFVLCAMLPEPGDLHLASSRGEEEEFGSPSDYGQGVSEQAASNWAQSVVSLISSDEGDYLYTSVNFACFFI
jgi:hypothetical protein